MYSKLTNGKSEKVSKSFIRGQKFVLPLVRRTDKKGIHFQQAGIPVVELDMVEMSESPAFKERFDFEPQPLTLFKPINAWEIRKKLKRAYKKHDFAGVREGAEEEIKKLEDFPTFYPMSRHMFESFVRMACMAELYMKLAEERGYESPRKLSLELLNHHLNALFGCRRLDKLSAPFQAHGIPFIHQDVPCISPYPKGWGPEGKLD